MTENDGKTILKGTIIVFTYDYFDHVHYDNRHGIITDSDYLTFDKKQLLYIFGRKHFNSVLDVVENYYGNLNEKQVDYIFKEVRYIIHINNFYNEYRDIRKYVFIDCIPDKRFTSICY